MTGTIADVCIDFSARTSRQRHLCAPTPAARPPCCLSYFAKARPAPLRACPACRRCLSRFARTCPACPLLARLQTRRALYDMFSLYCEEAQQPGQFRSDLRRIITQGQCALLHCSAVCTAGLQPGRTGAGWVAGCVMHWLPLTPWAPSLRPLLLQQKRASRMRTLASLWRAT